jgi:hypothetical protein
VGSRREEVGRLGLGLRAGVGGADGGGLVPDRRGVDDAETPAAFLGQRGPVKVEAPAEAELRERQQLGGGTAAEGRERTDLDEARLPY